MTLRFWLQHLSDSANFMNLSVKWSKQNQQKNGVNKISTSADNVEQTYIIIKQIGFLDDGYIIVLKSDALEHNPKWKCLAVEPKVR